MTHLLNKFLSKANVSSQSHLKHCHEYIHSRAIPKPNAFVSLKFGNEPSQCGRCSYAHCSVCDKTLLLELTHPNICIGHGKEQSTVNRMDLQFVIAGNELIMKARAIRKLQSTLKLPLTSVNQIKKLHTRIYHVHLFANVTWRFAFREYQICGNYVYIEPLFSLLLSVMRSKYIAPKTDTKFYVPR